MKWMSYCNIISGRNCLNSDNIYIKYPILAYYGSNMVISI